MNSTIILRAHTEVMSEPKKRIDEKDKDTARRKQPCKWPDFLLVFDCETRTDEKQSLTFGAYRIVGRTHDGGYTDVREEGFVYEPNETSASEFDELSKFVKANRAETAKDVDDKIQIRTREEFIRKTLFPLGVGGALIVGFNLPFDISRIAEDVRDARRLNDDWSFVMKDVPYAPRIIVTRKDGKMAFFRISGVRWDSKTKKLVKLPEGRFLDIRTLAWALRNVSYSLKSLCRELKIKGKLDHKPTGKVTREEIIYARQDVRATLGALNTLRVEFDDFPIDLPPDRAYSPASIVKAYLEKMGLTPPSEKFRLSPRIEGIAAQAFYGGRAECRIRRTALPVVHTDFKSEYPTVITLMGLWRLITAKRLKIVDSTREVRALLESISLDVTFDPAFWRRLNCFALVQPSGDILPVRTSYDLDTGGSNVGVNSLSSGRPLWYAIPDLIASALLSGRPPRILRAIRVVGIGQQPELKPTALGNTRIDPRTADFFKIVIETRERVKRDGTLPEFRRKTLGYFLKIMANAGYGIFIETTPEQVSGRRKINVFSGEMGFMTTSSITENKGRWYCPLIASLITSAGRLFLGMLECSVKKLGGTYLFADTDSMAIVATKTGGLVACVGGSQQLPNGREAIQALSWMDVEHIAGRFNRLNPYDRSAVPEILKIEDVNFENKVRRQIEGYAISAKRYTFFARSHSNLSIITPSEHGLGHIFLPNPKFDEQQGAKTWVVRVWRYLIRTVLQGRARKPKFFALPAMMRFAITTAEVFKVLQKRQLKQDLCYRDRVKPFNFILSPMVNRQVLALNPRTKQTLKIGYPIFADPQRFTLIAPFMEDVNEWYRVPWINVHDGRWFYLAPLEKKRAFEASPYTLDDVVNLYHVHPEFKSMGADGTPCGPHTAGVLSRTSVVATGFSYLGKETDRRWEQEEDVSMLFPLLPVYQPDETEHLVRDSSIRDRVFSRSIRTMSEKTGLSTRTIRAYRKSKRVRKLTLRKLERAIRLLEMDELNDRESLELKSA